MVVGTVVAEYCRGCTGKANNGVARYLRKICFQCCTLYFVAGACAGLVPMEYEQPLSQYIPL